MQSPSNKAVTAITGSQWSRKQTFFKHNLCIKPYVPRESRKDPSNRRLIEHGIYIRHCQESISQPVPSQTGANTNRPAVLNLWSADHWWSAAICLVVRGPSLIFLFILMKFSHSINNYAKTPFLQMQYRDNFPNLCFISIASGNMKLYSSYF